MTDNTEDPKKRPKNRFSHLFGKNQKKNKRYTNEQLELLSSLYKKELTLRELLYHRAPIVIIKRQGALVNEAKNKLKSLDLNEDDLRCYTERYWLEVLDSNMDTRLRETCPFWQEYVKKMQEEQEADAPCQGPCLGLFCPKRKTKKLKRK